MTKHHPDVLQNIEFVLVSAWRANSTIDDCVCMEALRAALSSETPADLRVRDLVQGIVDIRKIRSASVVVSDQVWNDGLRVIMDSVRFWSTLKPGAHGYLNYVSDFIV
jgi:hypothetical protein